MGDRVLNALVAETPDDLLKLKEIDGFGQFFQGYLSEGLEKATRSQAANIARAGQNIAALDLQGPIGHCRPNWENDCGGGSVGGAPTEIYSRSR